MSVVYSSPIQAAGGINHVSFHQAAFRLCQYNTVADHIFQIVVSYGHVGIVFEEFILSPSAASDIRVALVPDTFNRHVFHVVAFNQDILEGRASHSLRGQIAVIVNGNPVTVLIEIVSHDDNTAGGFSSLKIRVYIVDITVLNHNVLINLFLIGGIDQDTGAFAGTAVHGLPHLIGTLQVRYFQIVDFPVLFVVNGDGSGNRRTRGTVSINYRAASFAVPVNGDGSAFLAASFWIQRLVPDTI